MCVFYVLYWLIEEPLRLTSFPWLELTVVKLLMGSHNHEAIPVIRNGSYNNGNETVLITTVKLLPWQ